MNNLTQNEQNFLRRIKACDAQVVAYEDEVLQALARSLIPLDKLKAAAAERCGDSPDSVKCRDFLLLELLDWFKKDFFTWTDSPQCQFCGGKTIYDAHLEPTPEDLRHDAHRIEGHKCETCGQGTRFPRYNDPGKLLETRTGRCGEWANCFTLCARAVGFEARYVLDWTDHVWTEVYSEQLKRWLHCDACENACDTPLMYEEGWNKKLSYVLAFGKDEIVDVSFRYSKNHKAMAERRREIRETVLREYLATVNASKLANVGVERRRELLNRNCVELVEFLFPRLTVKEGETGGRSSGSMDWRKGRGEAGRQAAGTSGEKSLNKFVFVPTTEEVAEGFLSVAYRTFDDAYKRGGETVAKWSSCVSECENIFRKVENDWKCVYLCRKENSSTEEDGKLAWTFTCPEDAVVTFERVELNISTKTFENGRVRATLCAGDVCSLLTCDGSKQVIELNECKSFKIELTLMGGTGRHMWQHSQAFRTSFHSAEPSFIVYVKLKRKPE